MASSGYFGKPARTARQVMKSLVLRGSLLWRLILILAGSLLIMVYDKYQGCDKDCSFDVLNSKHYDNALVMFELRF